jgi:hypothetical protein
MSSRSTATTESVVDVNVPRFNQAVVAVVTALAFLLQEPFLVVLMAIVLALSAFGGPRTALLGRLYVRAIRPRFDPEGPSEFEPAAPPRFAQRIGAGFLVVASLAFLLGAGAVGWSLTLIVTALAALAAATRICVGCILYERVVAQ